MGNVRLDLDISIDDLSIGMVVYARDNFEGSNKVRPWVIRSIDWDDESVLANPITSKNSEFVIDIIYINGEKSFVGQEQVTLYPEDIESIAPGVDY